SLPVQKKAHPSMPTILPGSSVECDCNLPITYRSLHLRGSSLWSRVITKEDRQMRLGWRGVLCLMLGTGLFAIPFVYWRRFDLALPSFVSAAMIALAIAMRWKLRHRACFWLAMATSHRSQLSIDRVPSL